MELLKQFEQVRQVRLTRHGEADSRNERVFLNGRATRATPEDYLCAGGLGFQLPVQDAAVFDQFVEVLSVLGPAGGSLAR